MSSIEAVPVKKHGVAESIRLLLHYAGEKAGELKEKVEKWLEEQEKNGVFDVRHAMALARCIGATAGLLTGDHWMDAQLDTLALLLYDLLQKTDKWYKEADKKKRDEMKKELEHEMVHYYLKQLEGAVMKNGGFFSGNLSWLDILFVGVLDALEWYFGTRIIDGKFPYLLKLIEKINDLPKLKEYIEKRKENIDID